MEMVGASAPFAPPVCVAKLGDAGCRATVGEVAPVVEALRWWWLWRQRRRKGGLHAREGRWGGCLRATGSATACVEGRCPAPLKTKGKKRGNDLSEAFLRCTRHSEGDGGRVACVCPRRV